MPSSRGRGPRIAPGPGAVAADADELVEPRRFGYVRVELEPADAARRERRADLGGRRGAEVRVEMCQDGEARRGEEHPRDLEEPLFQERQLGIPGALDV